MPKRTTPNVYSYDSVKHGTLWRARYVTPSNRIVEKRGFLTKAEAEAWLTTEKSKLITGDWTDPRKSTVTVGSLAPAWLDIKKRTLKPSAYKPLETSWRLHVAPRWERVPLRRVVNGDIAAWLSTHPGVAEVFYPGTTGSPLVGTQIRGGGAMIAARLHGGFAAAAQVTEATRLITHAVSLGGVDSLIQHPAALTHRPVATDAKPGDDIVRLSIGLEHVDDLIADLATALDGAHTTLVAERASTLG